MVKYRSKTGPIPDDWFDNDPGVPGTPKLSDESRKRFDQKTAELKKMMEQMQAEKKTGK